MLVALGFLRNEFSMFPNCHFYCEFDDLDYAYGARIVQDFWMGRCLLLDGSLFALRFLI